MLKLVDIAKGLFIIFIIYLNIKYGAKICKKIRPTNLRRDRMAISTAKFFQQWSNTQQ